MPIKWSNWSGSQIHEAECFEAPGNEEEIVNLLEKARSSSRVVRTVGTAHSFMPFWTNDFLVSLDNFKGVIDHDTGRMQATVRAGSKLHELGDPLWAVGLAMENMGDIDRQSIAGAISTGTHGTGKTLRNISDQVVGLRLIKADGDIVDLDRDKDDELFRAAQVSLGTLGIITRVTLRLMPAFYMHERTWQASVVECAEQRETLERDNRHWEFFWDPVSDRCAMKTLNISEREPIKTDNEEIGRSYRIIPSVREFKFNEIEFSVPAESGWQCFMDIRKLMKQRFPDVRWPLEYRTLKSDNVLLSSASGRETVTISAHESYRRPHEEFFLAVENIFRGYSGRPHWGKIHTHTAADFRRLTPGFERFCEIRAHMDPEGRFLNSWLRGIFGIV